MSMTPFGGFVPLAAFFEKLGLLDSIAANCPAVIRGHLKIAYCDNLSRTTVFFGSLNFDTRTEMSC